MYYNSNKQANDYYNSYKREIQELESYEKQDRIQQIIKVIFLLIVIVLLGLATYFLYRYINPDMESIYKREKTTLIEQDSFSPIVIREADLPTSPQLIAYQTEHMSYNQEDIEEYIPKPNKKDTKSINQEGISSENLALIVQSIMEEINTKKELSLEEQLVAVESTKFIDRKLKDNNHYNKVVINSKQIQKSKPIQNSELLELNYNINNILENSLEDTSTKYSESIKQEITTREKEMRVIVVKKGDTLSRIAKRAYGDYNAYQKIFSANPEIIKNPDQIYEGMRLRIPS